MTEQDLKKLKEKAKSLEDLIDKGVPADMDYKEALTTLIKLNKIISDEETKTFSEKIQSDRYELDKDRTYSGQTLEKEKFAEDKKMRAEELGIKKREMALAETRQATSEKLETIKLDIEKTRLEIERENLKNNIDSQKSERIFRYISLGITTLVGVLGVFVPLLVYRKLAYANLKLIYRDEGRPTQDFKDAVRCIKGLTR